MKNSNNDNLITYKANLKYKDREKYYKDNDNLITYNANFKYKDREKYNYEDNGTCITVKRPLLFVSSNTEKV